MNDKKLQKEDLTNYFFVERFTQPVSPLGWSLIGPNIEEFALKEPLKYIGLNKIAQEKLVFLHNGHPYVKKKVFRGLFQIVPKKLITQDKLKSFLRKEDLKDFNFSFVFKNAPSLLFYAIKDWNWFPAYHFFKWKTFRKENEKFYKNYSNKDISELTPDKLIDELEYLISRTNKFLKIHRWSFVYSEVFYGLLKGLIRKWIPTIQLDESIEVAEKLCSGFDENVTAQMDKNLLNLATKIAKSNKGPESNFYKKELEKFIEEYSHRSKSLDIIYPTWGENSKFVESMIKQNVNLIKNDKLKKHIDKKSQRIKVTQFCLDTINETKLLPIKIIKKYIFNTLLRITQRFMILREVQRDQWHKILSQKRRVVLELNKTLNFKNDDIFFLKYYELKSLITGKTKKDKILPLINKRKTELEENSKKIGTIKSDRNIKEINGIGVSMGIAEGKARIVNSYKELEKIKEGDILITKVIDSSWTPVFNLVSGLVTEVGGMLSHASVVARELGIPAVASASDATKIIPNGKMIKINGKDGMIKVK